MQADVERWFFGTVMTVVSVRIVAEIDQRLCFGLMCDRRQRCTRYLAIDGAPATLAKRIDSCRDDGRYPLFIDATCSMPVEAEVIA